MRLSPTAKTTLLAGTIGLHLLLYVIVNAINSRRAPERLWDFTIPSDGWIPYLDWTWVFYYLGTVGIPTFGVWMLWQLDAAALVRAVRAFVGMIAAGAVGQLLWPARAPWLADVGAVQNWVHEASLPYANLPSMHVALAMLTGLLGWASLRSHWLGRTFLILGILISVSTLTMKEHFFLDVVTGMALALAAYAYWAAGERRAQESRGAR